MKILRDRFWFGAPGSNDPEYLDPYVTEQYLTYTFDGDKGFYDDTHTGVAIHFYSPRHEDGFNFAMWTAPLPADEKWKPIVLDKITTASQWRAHRHPYSSRNDRMGLAGPFQDGQTMN